MLFHSTNGKVKNVPLPATIAQGLAEDGGLFMPDRFPQLPRAFFNNIAEMSLQEIGYVVSRAVFGEYLSAPQIKKLVDSALNFPIPLVEPVEGAGKYILELFHGPTRSFKDVGSRFMAGLLPMLLPDMKQRRVLLATSGDSGGAIADAFKDHSGTDVIILFPRGELSREQTDLFCGMRHVKAIEIGGTFDDCQALVKAALMDKELNARYPLISANSINLARQFPAIIYYFHAYSQVMARNPDAEGVVMSVPCGNLGNLSAAVIAKKMGLPVKRFIGANNANDTFVEYLKTGGLRPRRALVTLARAMDVGNPSNLARIIDLYGGSPEAMRLDISGVAFSDREIIETIRRMYDTCGYILGPQSATAYQALEGTLARGEVGVAMASGHPANYPRAIVEALGPDVLPRYGGAGSSGHRSQPIKIPPTLNALIRVISNT